MARNSLLPGENNFPEICGHKLTYQLSLWPATGTRPLQPMGWRHRGPRICVFTHLLCEGRLTVTSMSVFGQEVSVYPFVATGMSSRAGRKIRKHRCVLRGVINTYVARHKCSRDPGNVETVNLEYPRLIVESFVVSRKWTRTIRQVPMWPETATEVVSNRRSPTGLVHLGILCYTWLCVGNPRSLLSCLTTKRCCIVLYSTRVFLPSR